MDQEKRGHDHGHNKGTVAEIRHELQHEDPAENLRFCPRCAAPTERRRVEADRKIRPVCSACGYIVFLNPKVVACALPVNHGPDGRVVLLRRGIEPAYGRWTMPGGYVDLGETAEEAAIRETHEEMGVEIELTGLLNLYSYRDVGSVVAVYLARIVRGDPQPTKEALEVGHFSVSAVPWDNLAFRSTEDALRDWVVRTTNDR